MHARNSVLTADNKVVTIYSSGCFTSSIFWHFLGSRGAYASQLHNKSLSSTCDTDEGAECLKYTGECSPDVANPSLFACSADPASQPGEISCWCQPRQPIKETLDISPVPGGSATQRLPELFVDEDLDRKIDRRESPLSKPILQTVELPGQIVRLNFEDHISSGSADYNDYIAAIEARDCSPERFPSNSPDRPACDNSCNASCPTSWAGPDSNKFRATAGLGIDESVAEVMQYEPIGRKLTLTVSLFANFLKGDLGGKPLVAALCPTVNFKWRGSPAFFAGKFSEWSLSDGSCNVASPPSEAPTCAAGSSGPVLPVSFSTSQVRDASLCPGAGTRGTGADLLMINESDCAAETHVREYEFRIADLDRAVGDKKLMYGSASSATIISLVESVDVRLFLNLPNGGRDFQCPSGVGASWTGNQPGNGDVFLFHMEPNVTGFAAYGVMQ